MTSPDSYPAERRSPPAGLFRHLVAGILVLITFVGVLHFFTQSVPFYFEDIQFIQESNAQSYARILTRIVNPLSVGAELGFMDRPVEWLALKLLYSLAGDNASVYHWFKNIALLLVVFGSMALILQVTGSRLFAGLAGLWLLVCNPVYQSVLWICDFEIVAQLFVLGALSLWIRLMPDHTNLARRHVLLNAAGIVLLAYIGSRTKASAVVLLPTILLSALIYATIRIRPKSTLSRGCDSGPAVCSERGLACTLREGEMGRKVKGLTPRSGCDSGPAVYVPLALFLLIVLPRLAMTNGAGRGLLLANIPGFLAQIAPVIGFVPLYLAGAICVFIVAAPLVPASTLPARIHGWARSVTAPQRAVAAVVIAWNLSAVALWPFLPCSETRYMTAVAIPAVIMVCFAAGWICCVPAGRHARAALSVVVAGTILSTVAANVMLNVHFRGAWGSQFIAVHRTQRLVEESYDDGLFVYENWRPVFYSFEPSRNTIFRLPAVMPDDAPVERCQDGTLRVPARYEHAFQMFFVYGEQAECPPGGHVVSGNADGWFEKTVARTGVQLKNCDLQTVAVPGEIPINFCNLVLSPLPR